MAEKRSDKIDWWDIAAASAGTATGVLLTVLVTKACKRRVSRDK